MSQQTNAGFNAPGFSVVADDPGVVAPAAIACPDSFGSPRLFHLPFVRSTESSATGVCHSACARIATSPAELPASLFSPFAGARLVGVGHSETSRATFGSSFLPTPAEPRLSEAKGVGHKPQAVPSVGRVDGTSRDNGRPAGVTDAFQVSEHSVEPVLANRRRNLLSHEDSGPSGTGEPKIVGPQVPIVSLGFSLAGDAERLARRRAGPELAAVGPSGETGGDGPSTDAGEEVALPKPGKVV
jgi:hypothetical protein